jgi:hypothetical protein
MQPNTIINEFNLLIHLNYSPFGTHSALSAVQQAYVPSAQPLTDEPSTDHKAIPKTETTDLN